MVLIHIAHIELFHYGKHAGMHGPRVFATKALAEAWAAEKLYEEFDGLFYKDQLLDWQLDPADFQLFGDMYVIPESKKEDYAFMSAFLEAIYQEDMELDATVHFDTQELEFPSLEGEEDEPPKKKQK